VKNPYCYLVVPPTGVFHRYCVQKINALGSACYLIQWQFPIVRSEHEIFVARPKQSVAVNRDLCNCLHVPAAAFMHNYFVYPLRVTYCKTKIRFASA